ncbi:MAG: MiaB/RimO family radical SAM methylthiotransferase [Planctomycetes bacterium]|nr:MiaB/RimO family radical SAM methylthiotransferase [Planctomycetota bacterium]
MTLFSITTLGCKINQYESAALSSRLKALGLEQFEAPGIKAGRRPDLVIINTCCVTATAMRKSRQAIRRLVRSAAGSFALVIGCYATYDGRQAGKILACLGLDPGKAFICGHQDDLEKILAELAKRLCGPSDRPPNNARSIILPAPGAPSMKSPEHPANGRRTFQEDIKAKRLLAVKRNPPGMSNLKPVDNFPRRQRAFVKVQDGCDAFCSYCIVPYTRPVVRFRPAEEIVCECENLVRAGYKEIVLSGVFLGAYGQATAIRRKWTPCRHLPELIQKIAGIDGLWRLRLSSLEPLDATDELLAVCRNLPNFAPHFHLPLQSGSPKILRRMNRQYSAAQYRSAADRIRRTFDRPAITTDIIAGFPGETGEDFQQTLEMAEYCGFSKIHAFPFSPINGTAAWNHRGQMPPTHVVKARLAELAQLESRLAISYRAQFVGQTVEAIVEGQNDSDSDAEGVQIETASPAGRGRPANKSKKTRRQRQALTDRYLNVFFDPPEISEIPDLTGSVVSLAIQSLHPDGLAGSFVKKEESK